MSRRSLIALGLVVLVVGTGCGKSEKAVTKAQYNALLQGIGHNLYVAANNLGQSTNTQIFNSGVDTLKGVVHDSAGELDGVRPPGVPAQQANDRLVRAYRALEKQFDNVKAARRVSYPQAVAALQAVEKSPAARETIRAGMQLRRLGYTVPVFAMIGGSA